VQQARETRQITAELRALGVAADDLLMVHTSMRALGPVAGGAAGLLTALEEAVGAGGTVLVNLGAQESGVPFDVHSTPADPDVGVFAEVFRTTGATVCNDHPDGRFGARGPLAEELLRDLPWNDYYGPGSHLERFADLGGKVLRLGADQDTVTLIHLAEYRARIPGKRRVRRRHALRLPDGGTTVATVSCLDDSAGIRPWTGEDYFALILRDHLATGSARQGLVGDARSELLDAQTLLTDATVWMERHLTRETAGD